MKAGTNVPGPRTDGCLAACSAPISNARTPVRHATNGSDGSPARQHEMAVPRVQPLPVMRPSNSWPLWMAKVLKPSVRISTLPVMSTTLCSRRANSRASRARSCSEVARRAVDSALLGVRLDVAQDGFHLAFVTLDDVEVACLQQDADSAASQLRRAAAHGIE